MRPRFRRWVWLEYLQIRPVLRQAKAWQGRFGVIHSTPLFSKRRLGIGQGLSCEPNRGTDGAAREPGQPIPLKGTRKGNRNRPAAPTS